MASHHSLKANLLLSESGKTVSGQSIIFKEKSKKDMQVLSSSHSTALRRDQQRAQPFSRGSLTVAAAIWRLHRSVSGDHFVAPDAGVGDPLRLRRFSTRFALRSPVISSGCGERRPTRVKRCERGVGARCRSDS
jgi:hypothetical protein